MCPGCGIIDRSKTDHSRLFPDSTIKKESYSFITPSGRITISNYPEIVFNDLRDNLEFYHYELQGQKSITKHYNLSKNLKQYKKERRQKLENMIKESTDLNDESNVIASFLI